VPGTKEDIAEQLLKSRRPPPRCPRRARLLERHVGGQRGAAPAIRPPLPRCPAR